MRICIQNIVMTPGVYQTDRHIPFVPEARIHIEGNRIVYAGKREEAPAFEADRVIDGGGALAMPGLCNMHTHTPMTLLRNVGGGLRLEDWLHKAIFPLEAGLTDEAVRAGTDLGILEMLSFGITSFCDMYMHMEAVAEGVRDSGMRALLGHGIVDFDESCADLEPGIAFARKWHKAAGDRIRVSLDPHSEGATTQALMRKVGSFAGELGLPIHVHVSETKFDVDGCLERHGMTPPQYLDSLGLLEYPIIAAHCVWFTPEDIALFARKGCTIVHNPVSNLKLASGVAPIQKMLEAGCKVAIGTDGVASNNNLNLWEEMRLMPLLQKGTMLDPTIVSPAQCLAAATTVGAAAMGYPDLGLLKEGYLADLILVDLRQPGMVPLNELEDGLIYATQGSYVKLTMVDGQVLYQNGEYFTLDKEAALARGARAAQELADRAKNRA